MKERGLSFRGFSEEEKKNIKYVISDVDDTITKHGKLYPSILAALWRLKAARKSIYLVTGGSVGWADCYLRQWPVDGVIAESGAIMVCYSKDREIAHVINPSINQREVMQKRSSLIRETRGLTFSSDQSARDFDVAYEKSTLNEVERKVLKNKILSLGGHFAESSIHINAWFGEYNKQNSVKDFFSEFYRVSEEELLSSSLYVGDSYNDQELFGYIPMSIGVHSVEEERNKFTTLPLYITHGGSGDGFVEVADALVGDSLDAIIEEQEKE